MNLDDPKLTAYALGELPEDEAVEFERVLAEDKALQEALEEIRETAGMVRSALGDESASASILTSQQEEQMIMTAIKGASDGEDDTVEKIVRVPFYRKPAILSMAAAIVMVFALVGSLTYINTSDIFNAQSSKMSSIHVVETTSTPRREYTTHKVPASVSSPKYLTLASPESKHRGMPPIVNHLSALRAVAEKDGSIGSISNNALMALSFTDASGLSSVTTSSSITESSIYPPMPPPYPISGPDGEFNTEAYDSITDNPFLLVKHSPLSTFSIDVDTASYANIRRFLSAHQRPPRDAVRIEELVNYFSYDYSLPEKMEEHPLKISVEAASAPWQEEHRLVRVALKGRDIDWEERPASNVVFLLDVSGSMQSPNKLPLVKKSVELLVRKFGKRDRVAIVTYAGQSRVALPSTTADNRETILHAIGNLTSGGSTHASAGIEDAYRIAEKHFVKGGYNRIILCTDGDFNIGVTNRGALVDLIEEKAKKGIFLTILGFGMGNYKDATLEELSNKGNGNYGYIDTLREARKVFVEQVAGTMITVAKDVKIQVEFNPAKVQAYRLIGYENRRLAAEDFNDDKKDAGEIGAGHTVTAFYEVVPAGMEWEGPGVDPLKYQKPVEKPQTSGVGSEEMLTVKLRYKLPEAETSAYLELPFVDSGKGFEDASVDFRFAAGVAAFGMVLRDSPYKGSSEFALVRSIAEKSQGNNRGGYRSEFLHLIDQAEMVMQ